MERAEPHIPVESEPGIHVAFIFIAEPLWSVQQHRRTTKA